MIRVAAVTTMRKGDGNGDDVGVLRKKRTD